MADGVYFRHTQEEKDRQDAELRRQEDLLRSKRNIRTLVKKARVQQTVLNRRLVQAAGSNPTETVWYAVPRDEEEPALATCPCTWRARWRETRRVVPVTGEQGLPQPVSPTGDRLRGSSGKYRMDCPDSEPRTPTRSSSRSRLVAAARFSSPVGAAGKAISFLSPITKHRGVDDGTINEWRQLINQVCAEGGNKDAGGTKEPVRKTAVWLMMSVGRRKGQWRKMFPLQMGGDEWFTAMETKNHEIARKARVKRIQFELIMQLEPDKEGMKKTTVGSSVRQAFTIFVRDVMDQPRTLGAFALFYIALVWFGLVIVMLRADGISLLVAWSTVTAASMIGYLIVRRQHSQSIDLIQEGQHSTADIIWANFSVIRAMWGSILLLLLVPTTLMTLPDDIIDRLELTGETPDIIARAGGLLFLAVLWLLGWVFLWLQNSGGGVLARCDTFLMSTSSSTQVRRQVLEHVQEYEADGKTPLMVPRASTAVYIKRSNDSGEVASSGWQEVYPHRCCYSDEYPQSAEFEALEKVSGGDWISRIVRFTDVHLSSTSQGTPLHGRESFECVNGLIEQNHTDQVVKAFEHVDGAGGPELKPIMRPIKDAMALMTDLPPGWKMRTKLWTLFYEGFVYSGFAFFPALPWEQVKVPPQLPEESLKAFRLGILELDGQSAHYAIFAGAALLVPFSFWLLYWSRNNTERYLLVSDFFFSAMTFVVVKRMTDVFSCTAKDAIRLIDGVPTSLCADNIRVSCMDSVPAIECWERTHYVHILCAMGALTLYYPVSLWLRTESQSKSSVIVVDGMFSIVAFQIKMFLAVLASLFGDCYPTIIVGSMIIAVFCMMAPHFLEADRRYSNVIVLNVARVGGLTIAAINGLYAFYITWAHTNGDTWSMCDAAILKELADVANSDLSTISDESHEVGTYHEFAILIFLNVGGVAFFVLRYQRQAAARSKEFAEMQFVEAGEKEVDYPIIMYRLMLRDGIRTHAKKQRRWQFCRKSQGVDTTDEVIGDIQEGKPFNIWLAEDRRLTDREEGQELSEDVSEEAPFSGQQIEPVTLERVLVEKHTHHGRGNFTCAIQDLDVRTSGGVRFRRLLEPLFLRHNDSSNGTADALKQRLNRLFCDLVFCQYSLCCPITISFAKKKGSLGQFEELSSEQARINAFGAIFELFMKEERDSLDFSSAIRDFLGPRENWTSPYDTENTDREPDNSSGGIWGKLENWLEWRFNMDIDRDGDVGINDDARKAERRKLTELDEKIWALGEITAMDEQIIQQMCKDRKLQWAVRGHKRGKHPRPEPPWHKGPYGSQDNRFYGTTDQIGEKMQSPFLTVYKSLGATNAGLGGETSNSGIVHTTHRSLSRVKSLALSADEQGTSESELINCKRLQLVSDLLQSPLTKDGRVCTHLDVSGCWLPWEEFVRSSHVVNGCLQLPDVSYASDPAVNSGSTFRMDFELALTDNLVTIERDKCTVPNQMEDGDLFNLITLRKICGVEGTADWNFDPLKSGSNQRGLFLQHVKLLLGYMKPPDRYIRNTPLRSRAIKTGVDPKAILDAIALKDEYKCQERIRDLLRTQGDTDIDMLDDSVYPLTALETTVYAKVTVPSLWCSGSTSLDLSNNPWAFVSSVQVKGQLFTGYSQYHERLPSDRCHGEFDIATFNKLLLALSRSKVSKLALANVGLTDEAMGTLCTLLIQGSDVAKDGAPLRPLKKCFAEATIAQLRRHTEQVEQLKQLVPASAQAIPSYSALPSVVGLRTLDVCNNRNLGSVSKRSLAAALKTSRLESLCINMGDVPVHLTMEPTLCLPDGGFIHGSREEVSYLDGSNGETKERETRSTVGRYLADIDDVHLLISWITRPSRLCPLEKLDLSNSGFRDAGADELSDAMKTSPMLGHLTELDVSGNDRGPDTLCVRGKLALAEAVSTRVSLRCFCVDIGHGHRVQLDHTGSTLFLNGLDLGHRAHDLDFLAGWIAYQTKLKELRVNGNDMLAAQCNRADGLDAWSKCCDALARSMQLATLELRNVALTEFTAQTLFEKLRSRQDVPNGGFRIDISHNKLLARDKAAVANALNAGLRLRDLTIDVGEPAKQVVLTCNSTELMLSGCHLDCDDMRLLCAWLMTYSDRVEGVDLSGNVHLLSVSGQRLNEFWIAASRVKRLNVSGTGLAKGAMADALNAGLHLSELTIDIGEPAERATLLRESTQLMLPGRRLSRDDLRLLISWLVYCNETLETVDLSNNADLLRANGKFQSEQVSEFCRSLKSLRRLTSLNLTGTGLSNSEVAEIIFNTAIDTLYVLIGTDKMLVVLKRGEGTLDLRRHLLTPDDLSLVTAWVRHCIDSLTEVQLSNNANLLQSSYGISAKQVSLEWQKFCGAVGSARVESLGLADCGLNEYHLHDLAKVLGDYGLVDTTVKVDVALEGLLAVLERKNSQEIIIETLDKRWFSPTMQVILVAACELIDPASLSDDYRIEGNAQELGKCLNDRKNLSLQADPRWNSTTHRCDGPAREFMDKDFAAALAGGPDITSTRLKQRLSGVDRSQTLHRLPTLVDRAKFLRSWLKQKPDADVYHLFVPMCKWVVAMAEYGQALASLTKHRDIYGEIVLGSSLKTLDLCGNACWSSSTVVDHEPLEPDECTSEAASKTELEQDIAEASRQRWGDFCSALSTSSITDLNVAQCSLSMDAVAPLFECLAARTQYTETASNIVSLDISRNLAAVGDAGEDSVDPLWAQLCSSLQQTRVERLAAEAVGMGPNHARILASSLPESLVDLRLAGNTGLGTALVVAVKMDESKGRHKYWKPEQYQDAGMVQGRPFKNHAACPQNVADTDGHNFAKPLEKTRSRQDQSDDDAPALGRALSERSAALGIQEIKEGDVLHLVKPTPDLQHHKLKWMRIVHKGLRYSSADSGEACILEVLDSLDSSQASSDPQFVDMSVKAMMECTHVYDCPKQVSLNCDSHVCDFISCLAHHRPANKTSIKTQSSGQQSCLYLETETVFGESLRIPATPVVDSSDKVTLAPLTYLDLSNCGLNPVAIEELAGNVKHMVHIQSITITSTGKWERRPDGSHGHIGERYELAVQNDVLDVSGRSLGPEDAQLVASFVRLLNKRSTRIRTLVISDNPLFGSRESHWREEVGHQDTTSDPKIADGSDCGQYRIICWTEVFTKPIANSKLYRQATCKSSEKRKAKLKELLRGDIVECTDSKVCESGKWLQVLIAGAQRWLCACSTHDERTHAVRVRNQSGWRALCEAVSVSLTGSGCSSPVETFRACGVGLGPIGCKILLRFLGGAGLDASKELGLELSTEDRQELAKIGEHDVKNAITQLRSFSKPPDVVRSVIQALLLLTIPEHQPTRDWTTMKERLAESAVVRTLRRYHGSTSTSIEAGGHMAIPRRTMAKLQSFFDTEAFDLGVVRKKSQDAYCLLVYMFDLFLTQKANSEQTGSAKSMSEESANDDRRTTSTIDLCENPGASESLHRLRAAAEQNGCELVGASDCEPDSEPQLDSGLTLAKD